MSITGIINNIRVNLLDSTCLFAIDKNIDKMVVLITLKSDWSEINSYVNILKYIATIGKEREYFVELLGKNCVHVQIDHTYDFICGKLSIYYPLECIGKVLPNITNIQLDKLCKTPMISFPSCKRISYVFCNNFYPIISDLKHLSITSSYNNELFVRNNKLVVLTDFECGTLFAHNCDTIQFTMTRIKKIIFSTKTRIIISSKLDVSLFVFLTKLFIRSKILTYQIGDHTDMIPLVRKNMFLENKEFDLRKVFEDKRFMAIDIDPVEINV